MLQLTLLAINKITLKNNHQSRYIKKDVAVFYALQRSNIFLEEILKFCVGKHFINEFSPLLVTGKYEEPCLRW